MDRHLKFLVGEADKISSVLQERLTTTTTRSAESPTPSNRTKSSTKGDDGDFDADLSEDEDDEATIETEEKLEKKAHVEQEVKDLSKESAMNLDDILSSVRCFCSYFYQEIDFLPFPKRLKKWKSFMKKLFKLREKVKKRTKRH
jgi:hypothetical protein